MKWRIDKQFDFCYGHRVHNQTLNTDFTHNNDGCLACRHLHGHQGTIKIHLESDKLKDGMVVDFKMIGWFKNFLDDYLDHKFIMDVNDPLLSHEVPELIHNVIESGTGAGVIRQELDANKVLFDDRGFWVPNLSFLNVSQAVYEKYEGMVFVDFVPTSENLCAWLLTVAQKKMREIDVDVVAVDFWETPKSHCHVET